MGIFDTGIGKMGTFIQLRILQILKRIFRILTWMTYKSFFIIVVVWFLIFWIACVWNVLEIFGIVNFIFCGFFFFWENALHIAFICPVTVNFSQIFFCLNIDYYRFQMLPSDKQIYILLNDRTIVVKFACYSNISYFYSIFLLKNCLLLLYVIYNSLCQSCPEAAMKRFSA